MLTSLSRALVVAVAAIPMLWSGPALGQSSNGFDAEEFDAYIAAAVQNWDATGLAVAVVKDGEIVFESGYGLLDVGGEDRVDEHTRFAIGSTTKAMTAAAIAMLVDEGVLDWDDPVTRHLPRFTLSDPYVTREITIRDLLTHRAGLGNADFLWYEQDTSSEEILERVRFVEPAYSLRSGFVYQNIMYLAAGAVVEAASGMDWADFVRTRIFEPLEMSESIPLVSQAEGQPNVARPHDYVDGELVAIENASVDPVAPSGAIWSSVHDMSKWLRLLLAEGETSDGERLLSAEAVEELFTPQVVVRSGFYPTARLTRPSWTTYGFGWFQHDYRGRKVDFHTGSIDGMVAIAGLIRDQELGVYVLANRDHVELRHAIMYRVFDLFNDHGEPRDWSSELKELYDGLEEAGRQQREARLSHRQAGTTPSHDLESYAGRYEDRLNGEIRIAVEGEGLRLVYGPGLAGELEHWHHDTFLWRLEARWRGEGFVTFRLNAAGEIEGLEANGLTFRRVDDR